MNWKSYSPPCTLLILIIGLVLNFSCSPKISVGHVANGWSKNSVNTVIFRKHSLYTYKDHQYIGFYDNNRDVILGKRKIGTNTWELQRTQYKGNAADAHNSISLIVDTEGYLHISWDQHNSYLRYARSLEPESLDLGKEQPMIGTLEKVVTYPEFHALAEDMLFAYRSGESGNGDLILNKYSDDTGEWSRLQDNLIDGEGMRNAYWQLTTSRDGIIHISWVWRESADVASNHDLCYARSRDGGKSWERSNGTSYQLPITAATAEIIQPIPQGSELINQTSMTTTPTGEPMIVTYWKDSTDKAPQFKLISLSQGKWQTNSLGFRKMDFSLSGVGTKAIPISRPQVVASSSFAYIIFRDAERANRISVAHAPLNDLSKWRIKDLTENAYASWEPTLDPVQWERNQVLHVFLQNTVQIDGEGLSNTAPTAVKVLEWKPQD
ncbi:BNR repeat-containing protein [Marinoscillum sp.]|uniref:BNR repeat-containing protein n=1 Tax=Marinoscillum sp. TaxID=2024838 RepID=UPI003BAB00FE